LETTGNSFRNVEVTASTKSPGMHFSLATNPMKNETEKGTGDRRCLRRSLRSCDLLASEMFFFSQDLAHPSRIDAVVGGNVMLNLPVPIAEPDIYGFIERELRFSQYR
jgi:hypothetical protein